MSGERVLITGASSGIGRALAECFARDGSELILTARRADRLAELAGELSRRHNVSSRTIPIDLSAPEAPERLCRMLADDGVQVDVLVNNAAFGANGSFHQLDAARQMEMVRLNVAAPTELCRLLLPGMVERKRGGILNVASIAAFQAGPRMGIYYASKAYLLSLSEALAEELRGSGVKVSCLCPGPTTTEFARVAGMSDALLFRFGPMTAESVARSGYRGFRRGRCIVIPGIGNRLLVCTARLAPRWLSRKVAKWLQ